MPRMIYSLRDYDIHPLRVCMIYYPRLAVADNIEKSTAFAVLFSGATTGIRTRDLVITNDVLCQLSHSSALSIVIISNKVPFVNSFFALTENRAAAALPQGKPQNACHFRRRFIRLRKTSFCFAQNDTCGEAFPLRGRCVCYHLKCNRKNFKKEDNMTIIV